MRTEQLVDLLARQAGPAPSKVVETRLALAAGTGALASAGLALGTLGLNPALADMGFALAVKLAYVMGVLFSAAWLADRVSRPGAPWRRAARALAGVVLAMSVLAALSWATAAGSDRVGLLLGRSWTSCPWRVTALSAPALVALLWALRGLAPTRPRLAGCVAGLFAGSLGALGYALHCPELSPVFVLVWYSLGILVPALAGALVGPWVLRW